MTPREQLQYAYELAFFPPRLHEAWNGIKNGTVEDLDVLGDLLEMALLLHQGLPETGFASNAALARLARYQAHARAFGMVRFLRSILKHLGRSTQASATTVPGHMVRAVGLPALTHHPER